MRRMPCRLIALLMCAVAGAVTTASGQEARQAGFQPLNPRFRNVVPGVEVTIPPDRREDDTFSTHDVVDILQGVPNLQWTPKQTPPTTRLLELATGTIYRHKVWYLEFTFRPVRMIWVDMPQESGKMQRKLVWYMIYHVRNNGKHLSPRQNDDKTFTIDQVDEEVRFFPQFVLEAPEYKKAYLDRLVPLAQAAIQQKENPRHTLLNSVEIGLKPIPLSTDQVDNSVWGVAMWEEVDPRIDLFSIYVEGLTNAYRWTDPAPGTVQRGDPPNKGKVFLHKNLVLNFWRPGDEELEDQRIIRFGVPDDLARQYRLPAVDYRWVYR